MVYNKLTRQHVYATVKLNQQYLKILKGHNRPFDQQIYRIASNKEVRQQVYAVLLTLIKDINLHAEHQHIKSKQLDDPQIVHNEVLDHSCLVDKLVEEKSFI